MTAKTISPAEIGEYLSFEQCSRFFQHKVKDVDKIEGHTSNEFAEAFNPLNILLAQTGEEFEQNILSDLSTNAREVIELGRDNDTFIKDHSTLVNQIELNLNNSTTNHTILYQPTISGSIQSWSVGGHADFVLIWPTGKDSAEVRVIDAKSAKEQQTYHQIQASVYAKLIEDIIQATPNIDQSNITISAGVITRESKYDPTTPETTPSFELQPRITDISRLLSDTGSITEANSKSIDEARYQLNSKCAQCAYNESCATATFEGEHVRLLGLTEPEQQLLEKNGITSLDDLANLCTEPKDSEWNPTKQKKASFTSPTYRKLKSTPGFGKKLPNIVYRAQAIKTRLSNPSEDNPRTAWIPGTGKCELPDDSPPTEFDFEYIRGSMIRVYLNIQEDHLRDKIIQLSAKVAASKSDIDPIHISKLSTSAPSDEKQAAQIEKNLIEEFASELFNKIHSVAGSIPLSPEKQRFPLLHFYTYTSGELNTLFEAIERHESDRIDAFQTMIEGRAGIDKPRTSSLKEEIKTHIAIPTPSYGLVHAYNELQPRSDDYHKSRSADEWAYKPSYNTSKNEVNLRKVFNRRLFNISVDWERMNGDLKVKPNSHSQINGLKTRFRHGAEIPLGYQWAAIGRIDDQWVNNLDIEKNALVEYEINSYRYHDPQTKDQLIQIEDVETLGENICDVLEHIERSLIYKDTTLTENKEPINPTTLIEPVKEISTIGEASQDYLWLEHTKSQRDTFQHYRKLPAQRILTGESLPVQILDIDESKGNSLSCEVEAKIRFDQVFSEDPEKVKRVCKQKGSEGTSSGDWMVANPFDPGRTDQAVSKPYELEKGVNATIKHIDMKEEVVIFELRNIYWDPGEFDCTHRNYTTDKGRKDRDDYTYIKTGEWLILDPLTANISADRANKALDNINSNILHDTLENVRWGHQNAVTQTEMKESALSEFTDYLNTYVDPKTYPNTNQQQFIESTEEITLLQGPPGTGKTSGAIGPALCGRIHAAERDNETVKGIVTAPSNTAIDEMVEDTAELINKLAASDLETISEDNVELVRLTSNKPENNPENVTYADYNNDGDRGFLSNLKDRLFGRKQSLTSTTNKEQSSESGEQREQSARQSQIGAFTAESGEKSSGEGGDKKEDPERIHTLVFITPTKSWGLLKQFKSDNSEPADIADQELWNLLAVDEASMLTLPKLLLASVGLEKDAQVLVSGDQRQLPPVQKHDWEDEKRRVIRETVPYLSALDYLRVLRGDGDDVLSDEEKTHFKSDIDTKENNIPLIKLDETYRFGPDTADFIQDTVYSQDNISYTSGRSASDIDVKHTADSKTIESVFEQGEITLITYNSDQTFQQVNIIEAVISQKLLRDHHPDASAGLVTPHNAQRSRLKEMLRALENNPQVQTNIKLEENTHVETVERFQGGQQDLMIVSATVSDPEFIRSENEFLLEKYRANVSFTRHKNKLIVIVSDTLLEHIPSDPDVYDDALLWKKLPEATGEPPLSNEKPVWEGNLDDFVSPLQPPKGLDSSNISLSVYNL